MLMWEICDSCNGIVLVKVRSRSRLGRQGGEPRLSSLNSPEARLRVE